MQVEVRLADKEEQSLEKDLVYQQVCRLTDRVSAKVDAGKDDTLLLAKKVRVMMSDFVWNVANANRYRTQKYKVFRKTKDWERTNLWLNAISISRHYTYPATVSNISHGLYSKIVGKKYPRMPLPIPYLEDCGWSRQREATTRVFFHLSVCATGDVTYM